MLLLTIRAVMLEEHVDLVAGDVNGAAWRRPCGNGRQPISIIEEAFADTDLPMPPGPPPLWDLGAVPGEWRMYAGFSSHRTTMKSGKYDYTVHSPFLPVLWASVQRIKAAHMRCGCTWHSLTIMVTTHREKKHDQRLLLKERSSPYQPNKERRPAHTENKATIRLRQNRPYEEHALP